MPKAFAVLIAALLIADAAAAQTIKGWTRVSFFGMFQRAQYADGLTREFNEVIANVRLRSAVAEDGTGLQYAFDVRESGSPGEETQRTRTNVYDAWVSGATPGGLFRLRLGQMWIDDLGGIGSVGGVMAEVRARSATRAGRLRAGVFGGLEPRNFDAGYVKGVKKGGAWIALDGERGRRHIIGYVVVRDARLTERSVLTTTNFINAGTRFNLYQAAEYDLRGPGGAGKGGLNYLFTNVRWMPLRALEITTTYHRGRSIDARTITQDILDGRPVDQKALDGFRFQSAGGRVTVEVMRNLRIYAGYSADRNNREERAAGRMTAGLWASNIARSGFDLTVSDSRIKQASGGYNAWYASLGRSLGRNFYGSVDYSTSLSIVRLTGADGVLVETRPRTKRYGANAVWNLTSWMSFLLTLEQLRDQQSTDDRLMLGTTFRF